MSPKAYTEQEEQLARFAKAMGHPARMAILRFLAGQDSCFFGDIHEVLPIAKATVSREKSKLRKYVIASIGRIGRKPVNRSRIFSANTERKVPVAVETAFFRENVRNSSNYI